MTENAFSEEVKSRIDSTNSEDFMRFSGANPTTHPSQPSKDKERSNSAVDTIPEEDEKEESVREI